MLRRTRTWMIVIALVAACSDADGPGSTVVGGDSPGLEAVLASTRPGQWRSTGDDTFEVWICRVPAASRAVAYAGLALRLPLTADDVTAVVAQHVTRYFDAVSNGRYRPLFVAGADVTLGIDDDPQVCIDTALAAAGASTRAVLVVADAEHGADQPGGFASGGNSCDSAPPCSAAESGRYAYVGANDFHPDWGDAPPMDLVQHEIGHTLGWVHSGLDAEGRYLSAIDVMSNSAAARELEPQRRDGPGTLAVNRLTAGWLPPDGVWTAPDAGGTVELSPSSGDRGLRLVVLPCCAGGFLTVELLTADGFDSHLPRGGIAVHLVSVVGGSITAVTPVFGQPPYIDLLQTGDELTTNGWVITVVDGGIVRAMPALRTV